MRNLRKMGMLFALSAAMLASVNARAANELCPDPLKLDVAIIAGASRFCDPNKPRPDNQKMFFLDKCESAASFDYIREVDRAKCVNRSDNRVLVACLGEVRALPPEKKPAACALLKRGFQNFFRNSQELMTRYRAAGVDMKNLGEPACGGLLEKSVEWLTEDIQKVTPRVNEVCP